MNTFYGDNNRWFVGKVISVEDPLEQGRVRVRIFGVHPENLNDVKEADLPWAQIMTPITEGGVSGIGTTTGIKRGSQVFGIFFDGKESQLPVVFGSIPRFEFRESTEEQVTEKATVQPSVNDAQKRAIGSSNAEKAFNYFLSKGFTEKQSAGILGNLIVESNVDPLAINDTERKDGSIEGSYGIAQWNPAPGAQRYQELLVWCGINNRDVSLLETQLDYIIYELNLRSTYYELHRLKAAETIEDAVAAFERYEKPEGWTNNNPIAKSRQKRVNAAKTFYSAQTGIG